MHEGIYRGIAQHVEDEERKALLGFPTQPWHECTCCLSNHIRREILMSEKVADIPEQKRLEILTTEQTAISGLDPEALAERTGKLEVVIREARLRLQVNVSKRASILADMETEEKKMWAERSKKFKTDKPTDEDGPKRPRAPSKSKYEKAVESMMAALGMSRDDAEKHCLRLKGGA